jgi:hypothetical protein
MIPTGYSPEELTAAVEAVERSLASLREAILPHALPPSLRAWSATSASVVTANTSPESRPLARPIRPMRADLAAYAARNREAIDRELSADYPPADFAPFYRIPQEASMSKPSPDPLALNALGLREFFERSRPPDARGAVDEISVIGGGIPRVEIRDSRREHEDERVSVFLPKQERKA